MTLCNNGKLPAGLVFGFEERGNIWYSSMKQLVLALFNKRHHKSWIKFISIILLLHATNLTKHHCSIFSVPSHRHLSCRVGCPLWDPPFCSFTLCPFYHTSWRLEFPRTQCYIYNFSYQTTTSPTTFHSFMHAFPHSSIHISTYMCAPPRPPPMYDRILSNREDQRDTTWPSCALLGWGVVLMLIRKSQKWKCSCNTEMTHEGGVAWSSKKVE